MEQNAFKISGCPCQLNHHTHLAWLEIFWMDQKIIMMTQWLFTCMIVAKKWQIMFGSYLNDSR